MIDILNLALAYFGLALIGFACGRLPMTGRLSLRAETFVSLVTLTSVKGSIHT